MPILQVIVLAVVQGLTEFLPISSTAHLYLTSWLLGWQIEGLDFDIALHIGTLLAVLLYFARDWMQIIAQGFGIRQEGDRELNHNHMLLWLLLIGTVPVGVAGLLFNKQAETTWRNPLVMGFMMIAVGVLMWIAENAGKQQRDLSSPAIAAAAAKAIWDMHKKGGGLHGMLQADFLVGVGISAITGCAVIAWFLHYLRRNGLRPFVYYRILFGIIVLALAFIRRPA